MATFISSYLGAVGIGVHDLDRSVGFYSRVFGMKKIWKLKLPHLHEVILNLPEGRGSSLVLMHYMDGSNPN